MRICKSIPGIALALILTGAGLAQDALSAQLAKADSGDLDAQMAVAEAFRYGIGTDKDIDAATEWYKRAAAQSDPRAMFELGVLAYAGVDPDDRSEAALAAARVSAGWIEAAATSGFAQAQSTLGLMYGFGDRVGKDPVRGRMWLTIAELNGFAPSGTMVGMLEKRLSDAEIASAAKRAETCMASGYVDCD